MLTANQAIKPLGPPVDGQQKMQSVPGDLADFEASDTDSVTVTNAVDVQVLSTDVEKSLGLATGFFDVLTDDLFTATLNFPDVIGNNPNAKFQLILKETVSDVIIAEGPVEVGNATIAINTFLVDSASGDEPAANIEVFATGITGTIDFNNDGGSPASLTLLRTRDLEFKAISIP